MANDGFMPTRKDGTNHGQARRTVTTKKQAEVIEKAKQAVTLRIAGASFREIGEALGHDPTYARTLVLKALAMVPVETIETVRQMESDRLDRLQRAHWTQALQGDAKASNLVLTIMQRRARLLGLDAPVQVEQQVTIIDGSIDAEVARLTEEMGLAAEAPAPETQDVL